MRIARYEDGDTLIKTFESITLQKKKKKTSPREFSLPLKIHIPILFFNINQL